MANAVYEIKNTAIVISFQSVIRQIMLQNVTICWLKNLTRKCKRDHP